MRSKHPEHKSPIQEDSLLAKTFALKHLMSLGLPPQPGQFPADTKIENTKAIMIKKPNQKQRGIIIHQIYKTPGAQ